MLTGLGGALVNLRLTVLARVPQTALAEGGLLEKREREKRFLINKTATFPPQTPLHLPHRWLCSQTESVVLALFHVTERRVARHSLVALGAGAGKVVFRVGV